jgi:hypothetical protein
VNSVEPVRSAISSDPAGPGRWWVYQRERFPLIAHGPLIACFSFCAISYSAQLRGVPAPALAGWVVAFVTCLFSFLHLRVADEFKDAGEDARWRPYRPVPRGLVKLRELGWIWAATAAVQLASAVWFSPGWHLAGLLLVTWAYLSLMTREFFCREWLKARPLLYLWSHMFIMPLVDLYATACDWVPAGEGLPTGLGWFLVVSYCNGLSLELGRKIRAPRDEEAGVETYSVLWGRPRAVAAWWGTLLVTALAACAAAARIGFAIQAAIVLGSALVVAAVAARAFLQAPETRAAKRIETFSGLWTMILYLTLGALPLLLK